MSVAIKKSHFSALEEASSNLFVLMKGLSFDGKSFGMLKLLDAEGNPTPHGRVVETFLRQMYNEMPSWEIDVSKTGEYHIPIFEYTGQEPDIFAALQAFPFSPVESQQDESAKIMAYWFYLYPQYHRDVLRYLEIHQNHLLLPKKRHDFYIAFRYECFILMFSRYHIQKSGFLYWAVNKNMLTVTESFQYGSLATFGKDLISNLNKLKIKVSLQEFKHFISGLNDLEYMEIPNIRVNGQVLIDFFEKRDFQPLCKQIISLIEGDRWSTETNKELTYKIRNCNKNNYNYVLKFPFKQLPKETLQFSLQDSALSPQEHEAFTSLFNLDFLNHIHLFPQLVNHTFFKENSILEDYQNNKENGSFPIKNNGTDNIDYCIMPINLYWLMADMFLNADNETHVLLSYSPDRIHYIFNVALKKFSIGAIKESFMAAYQIFSLILSKVHHIQPDFLLKSRGLFESDIISMIEHSNWVKYHENDVNFISRLLNFNKKSHFFYYDNGNRSASYCVYFTGKEKQKIYNDLPNSEERNIFVFKELRKYAGLENRIGELDSLVFPKVWLVMCLQKWLNEQTVLQLS